MKTLTVHEGVAGIEGKDTLDVSTLEFGKCRGCLACRFAKKCVSYNDDAQKALDIIKDYTHLDIHLTDGQDTFERLLYRMLYGLKSTGRTYTLNGATQTHSASEVARLLNWLGYKQV